jgi:hypothetical protein
MHADVVRLASTCLLAGLLVLCGGCATLTKGSSQSVTVHTDPAGATCTLTRESSTVAVVNPTPGTVTVSKSHTDLGVRCARDGYLDAVGTIGSKFQAMTFGNILFGGLIGVVVDAASGATAEYDPSVTIVLVPAAFPTEQARDEFFDRRREEFKVEARKVKERIETMCAGGPDCGRQLKEAEVQEAVGLTRIEDQRKAARIGAAAKT